MGGQGRDTELICLLNTEERRFFFECFQKSWPFVMMNPTNALLPPCGAAAIAGVVKLGMSRHQLEASS